MGFPIFPYYRLPPSMAFGTWEIRPQCCVMPSRTDESGLIRNQTGRSSVQSGLAIETDQEINGIHRS